MSSESLPVKVPGQPMTCTAHSSKTGELCQNPALDGMRVCRFHGGSTKLAKQAAQERLDAMLERAVDRISELSEQDEHMPTSFAATKEILNRTLGPTQTSAPAGSGITVQIGIGFASALKPGFTVVEGKVVRAETVEAQENEA